MIDLEPYIYRPHPIYRLPSREDAAVACQTAEEARTKTLAELTGDEVVQDCLGEILAIETISVLETA